MSDRTPISCEEFRRRVAAFVHDTPNGLENLAFERGVALSAVRGWIAGHDPGQRVRRQVIESLNRLMTINAKGSPGG